MNNPALAPDLNDEQLTQALQERLATLARQLTWIDRYLKELRNRRALPEHALGTIDINATLIRDDIEHTQSILRNQHDGEHIPLTDDILTEPIKGERIP